MRKKNAGIRFTRISFFSFAATFLTIAGLVENPAFWPSQISRTLFKSTIIQPNSTKIAELNQAFNWWLDNWSFKSNDWDHYTYYGVNLNDTSKPMEDVYFKRVDYNFNNFNLSYSRFYSENYYNELQKLMIIDFFIQTVIITWTNDSVTWNLTEHIPVPDEALMRWHFSDAWKKNSTSPALHAWEDCKGIADVTVSFIRRLIAQGNLTGEAHIACGQSHWFTAVSINKTTPMVFLNHWYEIHVYCIYMDDNLPAYGQNVLETLNTGLLVTSDGAAEYRFYLGLLMGNYFGLVILASIVLAALVTMLFGYPRDYDVDGEKKHVQGVMDKWSHAPWIARPFIWLFIAKIGNPFGRRHLFFWFNTALMAGLLVAGISLLFAIVSSPFFTYATIFMLAYIFGMLFVLDRDYITRGFNRIYKAIKKTDFKLYK